MVAKDRTPSAWKLAIIFRSNVHNRLTDSSDNLTFQAELVAESAGKVANATLTIPRHIRHLADVVEHVSASEKQHSN